MDASDLRRELYRRLAHLDAATVGSMTDDIARGTAVINEGARSAMMRFMTSDLLRRVVAHPTSPSMRLSVVLALDSIRDVTSRECAYESMLDDLSDGARDGIRSSMEFHAEIIYESKTHEDPSMLLRALAKLMRRALGERGSKDGHPTLLRIRLLRILVRRRRILAVFNRDAMRDSPSSMSDIDDYNRLCDRMSARFGSASNWILPTMDADEVERSIAALQATGILSFFCHEDVANQNDTSQSSPNMEMYCVYSSLRSTRERMGPLEYGRVFSHTACDKITRMSDSSLDSTEVCSSPLSGATDDVLIAIFSFLGFRSLARASTCCVSWKRAGDAPTLWTTLYFRKYQRAIFEEELLDLDTDIIDCHANARTCIPKSSAAVRYQLAASKRGHDWKRIFSRKYTTDKRCKAKSASSQESIQRINDARRNHASLSDVCMLVPVLLKLT